MASSPVPTGRSSVFGAFLDSTLDRLADGAIFASLAAWAALSMKTDSAFLHVATVCLALACVVLAAVVPYLPAPAPNPSVRPPRSGSPSAPTVWWSPWWRPSVVGLGAPQWVLSAALGLCSAGVLHHRRPAHCRG